MWGAPNWTRSSSSARRKENTLESMISRCRLRIWKTQQVSHFRLSVRMKRDGNNIYSDILLYSGLASRQLFVFPPCRYPRPPSDSEDCGCLGIQCCTGVEATTRRRKLWNNGVHHPEGWQENNGEKLHSYTLRAQPQILHLYLYTPFILLT